MEIKAGGVVGRENLSRQNARGRLMVDWQCGFWSGRQAFGCVWHTAEAADTHLSLMPRFRV